MQAPNTCLSMQDWNDSLSALSVFQVNNNQLNYVPHKQVKPKECKLINAVEKIFCRNTVYLIDLQTSLFCQGHIDFSFLLFITAQ